MRSHARTYRTPRTTRLTPLKNTFYVVSILGLAAAAIYTRFDNPSALWVWGFMLKTTPDTSTAENLTGYAYSIAGAVTGLITMLVIGLIGTRRYSGYGKCPLGVYWAMTTVFAAILTGFAAFGHYLA